MSGISNSYANKCAQHIFQAATFTAPTSIVVRLWTTLPGVAGSGGVEATGASYAAQSLTANSTNFPSSSNGEVHNGVAVDFGTIDAGGWGTLVGATVEDQAGTMIARATFASSI